MQQSVTPAVAVRRGLILVVAAIALLAAACSSGSGIDASETTTSTRSSTTTIRPPATTVAAATTTVATVTTTSTVAEEPDDGLTEEQTVLVEALVAAFNDQDVDAFLDLFVASPTLTSAVSLSPASTGNPERIPVELTYRWAMSEAWELQDCKIEYGAIDCILSVSDNLAGRDGALQVRLSLLRDDQGDITKMRLTEDTGALNQASADIYVWIEENFPEAIEPMWVKFPSGDVHPKLTDESIALRLELIPKYLASLDE